MLRVRNRIGLDIGEERYPNFFSNVSTFLLNKIKV